jgi:penicillin-binding protein 2
VSHLVGYVSEVTEGDLASNRYPGAELGTIVGKSGLEQEYDDTRRGTPGVRYIEVNARGRLVREQTSVATLPPTPGHAIHTTIDLDLQQYIDSIWPAGVRGAMVAMTPQGQVRALYSAPTYDPNLFIGGISTANWRALNFDSTQPLLNRAINGRYPPASPFKLAIAAMALKRGIVDFDTHMPEPCTGSYQLGNRAFHCWKRTGHGSLDLVGAIAASCDIYFYQLGLKLGLDVILKDGTLLGFHDRTGIDLPSEQSPIFPKSVEYFDKRYGPRNWSPPATAVNFSIGQGENTQTVINMVTFYEALAGNGVEVAPYIVEPSDQPPRDLGLTDEQLGGIRQALIAVAQRGTATNILHGTVRAGQMSLSIAGKTGTAENPHGLDHRWFIAMAPADKPQLVVGGMMENVGLHDPRIVRNTILALRRYVLGPKAASEDSVTVDVVRQAGATQ